MIHSNIYIPATIKIGKGPNQIAAVTFKNIKRTWVQPAHFQNVCGFPCIDNPRDAELVIRRDISNRISVHDNIPLSGFRLAKIGKNCLPDTSVFIEDPRGWQFRIDLEIFIDYLKLHHISIGENGEFSGNWCYCFDGERIIIINSEWNEYKNGVNEKLALERISNIKTAMTRKNLKVGAVYKIYSNTDLFTKSYKRAVYLGEYTNGCYIDKLIKAIEYIENARLYYTKHFYNSSYISKADIIIKQIIKSFNKPKMVFMFLHDVTSQQEIKFDGQKFFKFRNEPIVIENYSGNHQRLFTSTYVDEIVGNHNEFSFKFDSYYTPNNSFYITQTLDPLIIRGLDENQKLMCMDNWFATIGYRGQSIRHQILIDWKYNSKQPSTMDMSKLFNYSEYTVDELKQCAKYLCDTLIPNMIKSIKDGWLPTHN